MAARAEAPGGARPDAVPPQDLAGRVLYFVAVALAVLGGLLLLGTAALTVANIGLRAGFGVQLRGEADVVTLAGAAALFCFLPYGQVVRGHVAIEFATAWAPARVRAALDLLALLLFAALALLLAWRMAAGGLELRAAGQVTAVLRLPQWWAFVPAVASLAHLALVCLDQARRSLRSRP